MAWSSLSVSRSALMYGKLCPRLPAFPQGHFKGYILGDNLPGPLKFIIKLHIPLCPLAGYKLPEDRRVIPCSHCLVQSIQLSTSPARSSTNIELNVTALVSEILPFISTAPQLIRSIKNSDNLVMK